MASVLRQESRHQSQIFSLCQMLPSSILINLIVELFVLVHTANFCREVLRPVSVKFSLRTQTTLPSGSGSMSMSTQTWMVPSLACLVVPFFPTTPPFLLTTARSYQTHLNSFPVQCVMIRHTSNVLQ